MSSTKTEFVGATPRGLRSLSAPGVPQPPRPRSSLAAQLAWLNVGATAVLLFVAGSFLYWGLSRSLQEESERLLATKVDIVKFLVSDPAKVEELKDEIEHEAGSSHAAKYYIRVLYASGQPLLETPDMRELLPPDLFPLLAPTQEASRPLMVDRAAVGHEFTLMTTRAAVAGQSPHTLQIAQDVSVHRTILAGCRRRLAIVFVVGVAFAACAGILVARRSLRPLGEIAQTAQRITATKLDERLVPAAWPEELRASAAAFDAMLDRLRDSFNRLSEFSADIAHALRNPINNLRGETEVALTRVRTSEEYRQVLASSLEEYERLSRLIEGLMFIARSDDPRMVVERVQFSVRREMDAVREFYDAVAAEQHVTVTCEGDVELAGDPMLVRRAVSNLLGNALKHTLAAGRVTLAARAMSGAIEIIVSDTGRGIPAEHLPKVFDRFYQVDKTRDPSASGIGLGLAIVRSIMRLHGGTATIESMVGRGTTVTLCFPSLTQTGRNFVPTSV